MTKVVQLTALSIILAGSVPVFADMSVTRQDELRHMIQHDCGSCHGLTLNGGLGPALTVKALEERSIEALFNTIRNGVTGTPMPPWQGILSDEEISWIVNQLKEER